MRNYAEETEKRVQFIRQAVADAHADGILFGNSGGKDSALVGILCKMACENTEGIILPCSSKRNFTIDKDDGMEVAEQFGIKTRVIDLTAQKELAIETMSQVATLSQAAIGNLAPRLRMLTLYAIGASENRLVAGTGNASEYHMGYFTKWGDGAYDLNPIADLTATEVFEFLRYLKAPQAVITKDNVTMQIDTVVFFQITDPKLYTYGVESPISAIENLSATTLRNIIGEMELDSTLTSRDTINTKIRVILDEATDPWGIKVNRVELKNIIPPREIQDAMEKQMKAERQRREAILTAEGEKQSRILVAEGHKESKILEAEAEKQAAILHAEAVKEAKIREAEGEAAAIEAVQKATADAIRLLNEANAGDAVIKLKALEAFSKAADGQATKIIIPSEIQGLAGLAEGVVSAVQK